MAAARFRRRVGLALVAVVATLVVAEVGLRVAAAALGRERGVVYHPEFGWHYVPGLEKSGRFWGRDEPARTNARGWRDAPAALARTPGVRRIVALGDSFTFGVLADHGERFTEVLERKVPRLEVVNLGMNAIGPDQELRILEVEGVLYRPDVVVVTTFVGNDLDDIRYARKNSYPKPWYELAEGDLVLHPPEPTWDVVLRGSSYLGEILMRPLDGTLATSALAEPWRDADTLPLFRALLRRMEETAAAAGAELLVVVAHLADSHEVGRTERAQRVLAALEQDGLATVDTFEQIRASLLGGGQPFAGDGEHWSPHGHRIVAERIASALRRRGWME